MNCLLWLLPQLRLEGLGRYYRAIAAATVLVTGQAGNSIYSRPRPWESGRGSRSAKRQKKAPCLPSRRRRSRAGRISHRFSTEPNPKVRITINRTVSMLMYGPPWPLVLQPKSPRLRRGSTRSSATEQPGSTDSPRERHGLFRCGAFGAACVCRPSIQLAHLTVQPLIRFHLLLARSTIA